MALHPDELVQIKHQIIEINLISLMARFNEAQTGEFRDDQDNIKESLLLQAQILALTEEKFK